jgi:methylmalonyl-CoA mutase N-terminal domain/subunit
MGAARTEYLRNYRASRDEPRWSDAVTRLDQAWRSGQNMVPAIMDALRNRATMGEINEAMRRAQGVPRR